MTYGVIGIFDRIRDPKAIPGAGVAPPALLPSRDGVCLFPDLPVSFPPSLLSLSWRRRRNCSLFMASGMYGKAEWP